VNFYVQVFVLAIVQGAAELLPVSSSAHVILAERLLGLDPSKPELTFLLVMLHTGTMFAVIQYFWPRWRAFVQAPAGLTTRSYAGLLVLATGITGVLGLLLKKGIEKLVLGGPDSEVEELFRNLPLMAGSLFAVGILILAAGFRDTERNAAPITGRGASLVGLVQGLCLPFRGFSRSGATISTGLFLGLSRGVAEEFSFALAVLLTPPVVGLELHRLMKSLAKAGQHFDPSLLAPGFVGMVLAFFSGALALRLLSRALEKGRFQWFGLYCLAFAGVVLGAHFVLDR
jgi:undecaprenyl-diphosphatase